MLGGSRAALLHGVLISSLGSVPERHRVGGSGPQSTGFRFPKKAVSPRQPCVARCVTSASSVCLFNVNFSYFLHEF